MSKNPLQVEIRTCDVVFIIVPIFPDRHCSRSQKRCCLQAWWPTWDYMKSFLAESFYWISHLLESISDEWRWSSTWVIQEKLIYKKYLNLETLLHNFMVLLRLLHNLKADVINAKATIYWAVYGSTHPRFFSVSSPYYPLSCSSVFQPLMTVHTGFSIGAWQLSGLD